MKTRTIKFIFLILAVFFTKEVTAQTVQVCININGTPMPVSKSWKMCKKNSVTSSNFSVTLTATNCAAVPESNVTIKWKNLSVAPFTDSLDNIITAKDTGRWEATITNNVNSLVYKDTVYLTYHAPVGVTLNDAPYTTPSIEGCPLYDITLTATPSGAVASYMWLSYSPPDTIEGQTGSSYTFKQKNKQYIVIVKDANSCGNSDTSIYYSQNAFLLANAGPDPATFCEGNTFSLNNTVPTGIIPAMGSHTMYYGINNTTLGNISVSGQGPSGTPIIVTPPAGTSRYWIRVQQFPYCSGADTVVITTRPIPTVDINSSAASVFACYGANTDLTASIGLGSPNYTYTWSSVPATTLPTNSNIASNSNTITINPLVNATYTVSVTDVNNCGIGTDNIAVTVNPEIVTTTSGDVTICRFPTDSTLLTSNATGGNGGAITYLWTPAATLGTPASNTTKAFPFVTTTYSVTATDGIGCTDTESLTVTSYTPPILPNTSPQTINEDIGTTLDASINAALPTLGNNGATFEWTTTVSSTVLSSTNSISLSYNGPDTVFYVVKVTNPTPVNGSGLLCYNTDTTEIWSISNNTLMYIPNVFSPNAMNTQNQTIKIYGDNLLPDGFKWLIYNKWGNLMYETTDLAEAQSLGWNGGAMVEGVYSYVIVGKFKNGKDVQESKQYKGTFSLIK